jgi:hypothetical protein
MDQGAMLATRDMAKRSGSKPYILLLAMISSMPRLDDELELLAHERTLCGTNREGERRVS